MQISPDDIVAYERGGVICLRSVIDRASVDRMRDASVALMEQEQHSYADTLDRKTRMGDTATVRYIGDDARWTPRKRATRVPREPAVKPGEYPGDDRAFPIAWRANSGAAVLA